MRSYWLSMSLVAGLLLGYTAIVLNSHSAPSKAEHATTNPSQPREPAAASTAAAIEASSNVN